MPTSSRPRVFALSGRFAGQGLVFFHGMGKPPLKLLMIGPPRQPQNASSAFKQDSAHAPFKDPWRIFLGHDVRRKV